MMQQLVHWAHNIRYNNIYSPWYNNSDKEALYDKLVMILGSEFVHEIIHHKTNDEILMIKSLLDVDNLEGDLTQEIKSQLLKLENEKKDIKRRDAKLKNREVSLENTIKTKIRDMEKELEKAVQMMAIYRNKCEMYEISRQGLK